MTPIPFSYLPDRICAPDLFNVAETCRDFGEQAVDEEREDQSHIAELVSLIIPRGDALLDDGGDILRMLHKRHIPIPSSTLLMYT